MRLSKDSQLEGLLLVNAVETGLNGLGVWTALSKQARGKLARKLQLSSSFEGLK